MESDQPPLVRPSFFPIIASNVLATTMLRRSHGEVNGFIIEGPTAGGHNAPPRGTLQVNDGGEPIYGEKDVVDLGKIRDLGLPFWVAGGCASAGKLREVLEAGGNGIRVGTAFALCDDSGMAEEYRKGLLREAYSKDDGSLGYRCASEPVETYVAKAGNESDAVGRKCICDSLVANAGYPQIQKGGVAERPLLTSGDDLMEIARFIPEGQASYTARDVINKLLEIES